MVNERLEKKNSCRDLKFTCSVYTSQMYHQSQLIDHPFETVTKGTSVNSNLFCVVEYRKEAVELESDIDEAENRVQSMNLNPDNVDGRSTGRHLEDLKTGIEETSLYPIGGDVVDRGATQNSRQVNRRLSTMLAKLPLKLHAQLCMMLNVKRDLKFDDFRMLAEKVGFDRDFIRAIEQVTNPTDVILQNWSSSSEATVGNLIELLKGEDLGRMDVVAILEDWVNGSSD